MILYFNPSVFRCILLRWVRLLGFAIMYGTITLKLYRYFKKWIKCNKKSSIIAPLSFSCFVSSYLLLYSSLFSSPPDLTFLKVSNCSQSFLQAISKLSWKLSFSFSACSSMCSKVHAETHAFNLPALQLWRVLLSRWGGDQRPARVFSWQNYQFDFLFFWAGWTGSEPQAQVLAAWSSLSIRDEVD